MKRQSSFIYAHAHTDSAASASNKRRRQKEEFQYTAATIQTALANAGRPPMSTLTERRDRALPLGSVDMKQARVMTSSEFDREEAEMILNGDDQQQVEEDDDEAQDDDPYGYGDVSSMYMMANLIQSTRHYYSFDRDDIGYGDVSSMYMMANLIQSTRHYYSFDRDDTTSAIITLSNNISSEDLGSYNNKYNTESTPSEDNSDGLSSWTPSSPCNDLNDNDTKNIDNDNWSDGQSSCDIGVGESSDSLSVSYHSGSSPSSYMPKDCDQQSSLSFSIVG
eukprot:CAMPEP_0201903876 /NCGR_PEP_ID=MMETSP0902-20130614/55707_1 /ASSEMBLY_ACC=CAM_ASM_000551 /TAXON_ID=420261 /ORGANISM="Thalassiosira antarctica, Strain CCMP982" /LENGTH=277 /DNA_ID=CAMNT_0048437945 /DNA_START=34 /DNA_END=868 /DNA_ORIENTATION=+